MSRFPQPWGRQLDQTNDSEELLREIKKQKVRIKKETEREYGGTYRCIGHGLLTDDEKTHGEGDSSTHVLIPKRWRKGRGEEEGDKEE